MATSINQFIDDKELLLSRIKDLEFVDDVSEFKCKRCDNVLIQHYISNCGHTFCSNCKKLLGDGSGHWKCPECQEYVKKIDLQDFEFEKKLFDLRLRCANNQYGCPAICLLKELGEHLKTCEFTRENALPVLYEEPKTMKAVLEQIIKLNENFAKLNNDLEVIKVKVETNQEVVDNKLRGMNERMVLMNSDLHVITASIKNKLAEFESNDLHLQSNVKQHFYDVKSCLNIYEEKLSRIEQNLKEEIADDRKNLSFAIDANSDKIGEMQADFTVRFESAENQLELNNKQVEILKLELSHSKEKVNDNSKIETLEKENLIVKTLVDEMQQQMDLVNPQLFRLESYINLLRLQVQPVMTKDILSHRPPDYIWEVPDVRNLLKQDKAIDVESEVFQLNDYPLTARATLRFRDTFLSLMVKFDTENALPLFPLRPSMYLIIRNRDDRKDLDIMYVASKDSQLIQNGGYTRNFILIYKSKFSGFFNNPYVKNNTLLLEFHMESPRMMRHAFSYDGTLSWAIDNYKKTMDMNVNLPFHESPYFYVSPNGYRVQIRFWEETLFDERQHIFATIHFLDGEFDKPTGMYVWHEIPHKFTITYLNQKNPTGHIVKSKIYNPKNFVNVGFSSYCQIKCKKTKIENVLANDILNYYVKVETVV